MSHRLMALLITVGVIAVLLVVADRVSVAFAQSAASDALQANAPFDEKPTIEVHGIPFLTQAVRGRYDDIEVSGGGLQLGDVAGARLDAHLHGVRLSLGDVVRQNVKELDIDRVDGDVTLPYAELARLSGVPGLTLARDGGGVRITASVSIPVVGTVKATGTANVVVTGSRVRMQVAKLSGLGVRIPGSLLTALAAAIQVPITIPALPYGLTLTSVIPGDDGAVAHASGTNVTVKATP